MQYEYSPIHLLFQEILTLLYEEDDICQMKKPSTNLIKDTY